MPSHVQAASLELLDVGDFDPHTIGHFLLGGQPRPSPQSPKGLTDGSSETPGRPVREISWEISGASVATGIVEDVGFAGDCGWAILGSNQ